MNQLLTIIIAFAVATSPVHAEDLFSRVERADREFWRKGERALWTAGAPDRSALIDVLLSDDKEDDEQNDEDEHDIDYPVVGREADYRDRLYRKMGRGVGPGALLCRINRAAAGSLSGLSPSAEELPTPTFALNAGVCLLRFFFVISCSSIELS